MTTVLALLGFMLVAAPAAAEEPPPPVLKIQNVGTRLCLTPAGSSTASGTTIVQYACEGYNPRNWQFVLNQETFSYQIRNVYTHLCLSPAGGSNGLNVVVVQSACDLNRSRL
ncbi:RICIN domain-containing protein [Micromonospora sp. NPDC051141]|uniref:RICIN domain-containing protein n=1 Tax=Micromonospora sp. NPDC051141 TaxID=3364284 RepID=UPI0037881F1A